MQTEEKKSLIIIQENRELLEKLPACLAKHIEIYESYHRDILNGSPNSSRHSDNQGDNTLPFTTVSNEFVDTIVRLKNNFTELSSRYDGTHSREERKMES